MRKLLLLSLVGALMITVSPCWAVIPHLINYQGMLTDDAGIPINEPHDLTFNIYDAPTNGNTLWTETRNGVQVENGLFNIVLGETNPIPDSVFDEPERFLGIKVGTDPELSPRIQLTSVGYAYRASVADSAMVVTPGSGSNWTVNESVLYTNNYWGIARGDAGNVLYGDSAHSMVNLGVACTTGTFGQNYFYSTVSGGYGNLATGYFSTVGGGSCNRARGGNSVVSGGGKCGADSNSAQGSWSIIGAGYGNITSGTATVVMGGLLNIASGPYSTISGGTNNEASGPLSTVCGGEGNKARGYRSVVSGGGGSYVADSNAAIGDWSVVPGGKGNIAGGNYSLAAGRRAKALHHGCFVWADNTDADFTSTGANQFLIRASGGVGIGTNNPSRILHIKGDNPRILIEASSISPEVNFKNTGDLDSETWALYKHGTTDDFRFYQNGDKVTIQNSTGNVGIGTTNPAYKLDVNGDINVAGSYNIRKGGTAYTHPDYVFQPDYQLMSLDELKKYVFENKSLPNVISAEDVKKNEGFKMDELLIQMLEKIEEQTLYIFQLEERIAELERVK